MIQAFNTLGLNYVTFGNHEFDLKENDLIQRMSESTFKWISSNVFHLQTNQSFFTSIRYEILTIKQIQVLLIGLTIDFPSKYVNIINQTSLVPFLKQFLQSLSHIKYDVLIALIHLDMATDIQLTENIPQIDLILGGHEHEDYYLLRGSKYTPIYKADGNAFTVYIHRCAFNLNTKQFRIYSTLTKVTPQVPEQKETAEVVNHWFNLGMESFEEMGFQPNKTVSCLPDEVELDGRSVTVRNGPSLLSTYCCQSIISSTVDSKTIVGLFHSGSIRIDDIFRGKITQYDILRTLPYQNNLYALSVPVEILANALKNGTSLKGDGMYLVYTGVETPDQGKTWIINGTDVSTSGLRYNVATMNYAKDNYGLNNPLVIILHNYTITQTTSLINYLPNIYKPC